MLDPRPRPDVGDRVFALTLAGQVVSWLAIILAREVDLEHAADAEGFVGIAFDGVCGDPPE